MLQAPIKGYEDLIVVPPINADNCELKQTLINLVQSNQFTRRQDPHNHLHFFNKVTSTFRHLEVPNTTVKLLLFPFSLEGEARIWLDKEPSRSILTCEDLGVKIKESKLLIDKLDLPCDFLPSEYDSFISQDFSRVDDLPSTNNEDKLFNPSILSQENPFEIITHVVQDKKLATSNASLVLEDFDPSFYEPRFFKEVS
nr:reverse transcriptase domain-containing protein [Tanacetum cinerariifolium]